mmetsp:Transcript_50792/g.75950  ORF Transcript_50792/g.75950 Transcript_50792/m.75950 type:complete len:80 (+) Transcript_50792:102-341(+)
MKNIPRVPIASPLSEKEDVIYRSVLNTIWGRLHVLLFHNNKNGIVYGAHFNFEAVRHSVHTLCWLQPIAIEALTDRFVQ